MTMQILQSEHYKRMPWKNGGGETIEIIAFPVQASIEDFLWRISMASVATDGPFSTFANVDRTLCVLTGQSIRLKVGSEPSLLLTSASEPFRFPADVATYSALPDGPITDLNIMTNRSMFDHSVVRLRDVTAIDISPDDDAATLVLASGKCRVSGTGPELEAYDTVILSPGETGITLQAEQPLSFFVIRIDPAGRVFTRPC